MEVLYTDAVVFSGSVESTYERLLNSLGTSDFERDFLSSVQDITDVDRIYCFEQRSGDIAPELFCSWMPKADSPTLIRHYRTLYHRFDPIRCVLPSIPNAACASITFHANEIENNEYRLACFDRFSIRHRLSVVKHVGDRWLTMSVARRSHPFVGNEIESIANLARISLPIVAKHHAMKAHAPGGNLSVEELERRLDVLELGLTERERQVCARTIVGISAEGAALDLGISMGSVLTYRQRAYRRANVSNAMQLAAIVMH